MSKQANTLHALTQFNKIKIVIEIIAALIAIVGGIYILVQYIRPPIKVDIDDKQTFLMPIKLPYAKPLEELAIGIGRLRIANNSPSPITIKSIKLRCLFNGKLVEAIPETVPTSTLYAQEHLQFRDALIASNQKVTLALEWENINEKLNQSNLIVPSGVLLGDAIFLIGERNNDTPHLENIQLIVDDYSGNQVIYDVKSSLLEMESIDQGYYLIDREITGDDLSQELRIVHKRN